MLCRNCDSYLKDILIDLGSAPPSNNYLALKDSADESFYPLKVLICACCYLLQTEDHVSEKDLFTSDYAYFSSFSTTWVKSMSVFARDVINKIDLSSESFVVEVGSNDGSLLRFFNEQKIPCLGVEPTNGPAKFALNNGIQTIERFFGHDVAVDIVNFYGKADLIVSNNVLAHVPDLHDFVSGFSVLLADSGIVSFEFPHLVNMVSKNQFDTIYHEHFSYFLFTTVVDILKKHGLTVVEVKEIATHGGSLRVFAQHTTTGKHKIDGSVERLLTLEKILKVETLEYFQDFAKNALRVASDFKDFVLQAKIKGKKIIGYGAAAKGNTLLNYSGITSEQIDFVVDRNPEKIGKFLPGSHIPILSEESICFAKPDFVVVLPWNLVDEVMSQLSYVSEWGAKFVVAVPELRVY